MFRRRFPEWIDDVEWAGAPQPTSQPSSMPPDHVIREVLSLFEGVGPDAQVTPLPGGRLNATFAVSDRGQEYVLQRVHPLFQAEVHLNIAVATNQLRAHGFPAPELLGSRETRLPWVELEGAVWRLMTRLPGRGVDGVTSSHEVRRGARAFAMFHNALEDVAFDFVAFHTDVHDTRGHLARLRECCAAVPRHRLAGPVQRLGDKILRRAETTELVDHMPRRIMHGDPKIANVLFRAGEVSGIIDFDTVGPLPLHLELGDLWRSWCNPRGEDAEHPEFSMEIFEVSVAAYARATTLAISDDEREALVRGLERITLEQAARFAVDALRECYFGWDSRRFPQSGEHQLRRAQNQFALHELIVAARGPRASVLNAHFGVVAGRSERNPSTAA